MSVEMSFKNFIDIFFTIFRLVKTEATLLRHRAAGMAVFAKFAELALCPQGGCAIQNRRESGDPGPEKTV